MAIAIRKERAIPPRPEGAGLPGPFPVTTQILALEKDLFFAVKIRDTLRKLLAIA